MVDQQTQSAGCHYSEDECSGRYLGSPPFKFLFPTFSLPLSAGGVPRGAVGGVATSYQHPNGVSGGVPNADPHLGGGGGATPTGAAHGSHPLAGMGRKTQPVEGGVARETQWVQHEVGDIWKDEGDDEEGEYEYGEEDEEDPGVPEETPRGGSGVKGSRGGGGVGWDEGGVLEGGDALEGLDEGGLEGGVKGGVAGGLDKGLGGVGEGVGEGLGGVGEGYAEGFQDDYRDALYYAEVDYYDMEYGGWGNRTASLNEGTTSSGPAGEDEQEKQKGSSEKAAE